MQGLKSASWPIFVCMFLEDLGVAVAAAFGRGSERRDVPGTDTEAAIREGAYPDMSGCPPGNVRGHPTACKHWHDSALVWFLLTWLADSRE